MTAVAAISYTKITVAVAAGILLAAVIAFLVLAARGAAAERDADIQAAAQAAVIAECRHDAAANGKTVDDVHERLRSCIELENDFRARWNREP